MTTITNFQARFAFTNPDGTLTMEASRMFREWFARIGGSNSSDLSAIETLLSALTISVNDDKIELAFDENAVAIAELRNEIAELRQMLSFSQQTENKPSDVYTTVF